MRYFITKRYGFVLALCFFAITSCKDAGVSTDDLAPEIPDLSSVQPSFNFFKAKVATNAIQPDGENYNVAASLAIAMEGIMEGFSSLPESFTIAAENVEASYSDGIWAWEYNSSSPGSSVTIRLTAEVKIVQTNWAMYISVTSDEVNYDNYKLFDGYVKNTSNAGQWNFYSYYEESTSPVMTYDWDIEDEDNATFAITFGDASYKSLNYVKATPDNTLSLTDSDSEVTIIYWNETTGTGYVEFSGTDPVCWDETGSNVTCPV